MRLALLFVPVCVFCFLFVSVFPCLVIVWFFLWLPEEELSLLFLLHCENGDFSILMKELSTGQNWKKHSGECSPSWVEYQHYSLEIITSYIVSCLWRSTVILMTVSLHLLHENTYLILFSMFNRLSVIQKWQSQGYTGAGTMIQTHLRISYQKRQVMLIRLWSYGR